MVPETLRLSFMVNNESALLPLQPVSVLPGTMFQRLRIMSGGTILEDINLYARTINTFATCLPPERQYMDAAEGFGCAAQTPGQTHVEWIPEEIPVGGQRRVFMTLMSGLFSQHLWLPLSCMPSLTIELELGGYPDAFAPFFLAPGAAGAAAARSQLWSLSDARLHCDLCTLDSSLQSSYAQHLSQGKSLTLAISSFVTQTQRAEGANQTIVLARSFTRLKGIFINFFRANDATGLKNISNSQYCSHGPGAYVHARDAIELQTQIGSRKFPEYPITSLSEFYYRLRLSIGAHFGDVPISITPRSFRNTHFIAAFDFEKAATGPAGGVSFTGISTRNGELLTVDFKNFGVPNAVAANNTVPTQSFVSLNFDAIIELSADGVSISE